MNIIVARIPVIVNIIFYSRNSYVVAIVRDRPRGLGLLQLPTGMTDERSGPFFPNLYIAGDKAGTKPQTVPDLHLPGQAAQFTGRSAFNPFTQAVSAVFTEDLADSWGAGFGINGLNALGLDVGNHFKLYNDLAHSTNDASYQPFLTGFSVGAEFDDVKIREIAGQLNLPILGINELFDMDGRLLLKGLGKGVLQGNIDFPLVGSFASERMPISLKYLNYMADRHVHYGHVLPNVNLFLIDTSDIVERLAHNAAANPTIL